MGRRLFRSLLSFLATLWLLATLTFFLLRLLPGGPYDRERPLSPEVRAELESRYGLGEPISTQYVSYLGGLARGDLGPSLTREGETVNGLLAEGLPVTAFLALGAFVLALLVGVPLGVLSAARRGGVLDWIVRGGAVGALSLPSFLFGALLIYIFSLRTEVFPAAFWGGAAHRVLPLLTLALVPVAQVTRLVRASVLEQKNADFLRTARAKGLSEARVLWSHALRNSLLPLAALAGPLAANLFAGTVVVETLFALPGLGASFVEGISRRDYPLAMGLTLLYGAMLVLLNLLTDLSYEYLDPRLKDPEAAR